LAGFGKSTQREDPVLHFYEVFLSAYDPSVREERGVYSTPDPIVSYIVRSIDHVLKTTLGLTDGLADAATTSARSRDDRSAPLPGVILLDPACGTGAFLQAVVDHIYQATENRRGDWPAYVADHLLPRLFGFELQMAPYAIAHMKLGLQLQRTGYDFEPGERLQVYLTNTLEAVDARRRAPSFAPWLAAEASAVEDVKHPAPVVVVLGNPPYAIASQNLSPAARAWVDPYRQLDGEPIKERGALQFEKNLQNDYVKFISFAQSSIEQVGHGILAYITDHSYLDNPTLRGMRRSLMNTFDDIYVLDLHGNPRRQGATSDDQNVFDIAEGVAIGVFVKKTPGPAPRCVVHHATLLGPREVLGVDGAGRPTPIGGKYPWLRENDISTTGWVEHEPEGPLYLFIPQDKERSAEFQRGWPLTDIFVRFSAGVITARDHVVIDFEPTPILDRVAVFCDPSLSDEGACERLRIPLKKGWDVRRARKSAQREERPLREFIRDVCYRPFDVRKIFYHPSLVWGMAYPTMQHLLAGPNVALVSGRSNKSDTMDHFFCSRRLVETKCSERTTQSSVFPLYLYPAVSAALPSAGLGEAPFGQRPNLTDPFIQAMSDALQMTFVSGGRGDRMTTFGPEDVFCYMYAIVYSRAYRARYGPFLEREFARIPLTSNRGLFAALCEHGGRLCDAHLMDVLTGAVTGYPDSGDNIVECIDYAPAADASGGRVRINERQYFSGVTQEVWDFRIGGYQVCARWLASRKGRALSSEDLAHFHRMVAAIEETIARMRAIDLTIEENGGFPL
jgi:predicted helicase